MPKWLTKTRFVKFWGISPAYLWLEVHDKDKLPPVDRALQNLFDMGNRITEVAWKLFPEGKLIEAETLESVEASERLLRDARNDDTFFEAAVLAEDRLYARTDIVKKNGEVWDLYEVKMGTKHHDKPDYILDLAFQRLVWQKAGYKVGRQFLVLVNRHYVKDGEIEPDKLMYIDDVTDKVERILEQTEASIYQALEVIDLPECPDTSPLACDNLREWLPIYEHLVGGLPDESIYRLSRMSLQQFREMDRLGYKLVSDIEHPDEFKLTPNQRGFWQAAIDKQPTVQLPEIEKFLKKLEYPLYFFDYETAGAAIPIFDGARPYDNVPIQYSLHILDKPGGELRHKSWLHRGTGNPMADLITRLKADIGPEGSIVAWNMSFEKGVNNDLRFHNPEHARFLKSLNDRFVDLMGPFWNQNYVDYRFLGSASIKNVLPVLVPELSYEDLTINEGQLASSEWVRAANGAEDAEQIYADLEKYCAQDTMAMVKIYEFLVNLTKNPTAEIPF